jgi:Tfp pilus assembly protein PilO
MKNRTVISGVLVAVVIVGAWWMFLFSPLRSDASKVDDEIETAQSETRSLETQVKQIEDLERTAPEREAELDRLRKLVPEDTELASFIDEANALGAATGVKWVSVAPAQPTAEAVGTISLAIQIEGGYFEVLDYLNRMENLSRLVVIDQVSLTTNDETGAEGSEVAALSATLTARMFSQGVPTTDGTSVDGTTPTTVAGGGGVAATPQGQES